MPTEYLNEQNEGVASITNADGSDVPMSFPARIIRVTHIEPERSGHRSGKPWTLHKLFATEEDGTPITLNLRTFEALDLGPHKVTMEAYVRNGGVEHYTVKPVTTIKRAKGGVRPRATVEGACPGCAALEARVEAVERRLTAFLKAVE